jgi:hypothetical protein
MHIGDASGGRHSGLRKEEGSMCLFPLACKPGASCAPEHTPWIHPCGALPQSFRQKTQVTIYQSFDAILSWRDTWEMIVTTPDDKLDPEALAEAVRQLEDEEWRREAEKTSGLNNPVADIAELAIRVGYQAIETTGEVCVTAAKVGVEVVGTVIGGALDGL